MHTKLTGEICVQLMTSLLQERERAGAASPESDTISKISKSDSHVLSCPVLSDCAIGDGESGSGVVVF